MNTKFKKKVYNQEKIMYAFDDKIDYLTMIKMDLKPILVDRHKYEKMEWLTNICEKDIKNQTDLIRNKIIGPPQATESCTVEELENFKYIGVYAPKTSE